MKRSESIRTLLGVTQEEIADLLKVHPTQWSMYESGKRNLPQSANMQLAEILEHVQLAKAKASKRPSQQGKQETKEKLQALLKENHYQQLLMERKVAALEKKQADIAAALHLENYLANHTDKQLTHIEGLSKSIQIRIKKDLQLKGLPILVTCQIKQQVVQYEGKLLKAALEKL